MTWLYVVSKGQLWRPDGSLLVSGCYAGNIPGMNQPNAEHIRGHGPLPAGMYLMDKFDDHKGPYTVTLDPDRWNRMFGRSAFLMHGDNRELDHTASDGCIVAPHSARQEICESAIGQWLRVEHNLPEVLCQQIT